MRSRGLGFEVIPLRALPAHSVLDGVGSKRVIWDILSQWLTRNTLRSCGRAQMYGIGGAGRKSPAM